MRELICEIFYISFEEQIIRLLIKIVIKKLLKNITRLVLFIVAKRVKIIERISSFLCV